MKNTRSEKRLALTREFQVERLRRLIQEELTDLQRETLTAFYFEGKSISRIARERGVHRSTIWRTLHRTEDKLRKFLQY